ncbi:MAG: hypothetical protein ACRDHN_10395 [Thermomicrobiales bacterium]
MFGLWNTRKPLVYKHLIAVLPHFQISVDDFYAGIEAELKDKGLQGLAVSRAEYAEGGLLSAKRTYLRMQRERLIFDVCAAPFGTEWFFSYRASEIPCSLRVWELLVLLMLLAGVVVFYAAVFGWLFGSALFALSVLGIAILMRNALAFGLHDLDASLLRVPILGGVYEALLRKETYYREDTRAAYLEIVENMIREKIEEVTSAKGVKLARFLPANTAPPGIARVLSALFRITR